jgi:hypothetical protein
MIAHDASIQRFCFTHNHAAISRCHALAPPLTAIPSIEGGQVKRINLRPPPSPFCFAILSDIRRPQATVL